MPPIPLDSSSTASHFHVIFNQELSKILRRLLPFSLKIYSSIMVFTLSPLSKKGNDI